MTEASSGCGGSSQLKARDEQNSARVWPVCSGKSFNVWEPDTGIYYDSADADQITEHLYQKRLRQSRTNTSAFHDLDVAVIEDPSTLHCLSPRIAFRDVARATDTRTMVAALIPGERVTTHKAPYLLQMAGDRRDEAYVLGILCSMIFDWQARRAVELNMTFTQLGGLSIPDPGPGDRVRDRVVEIAGYLASVDERYASWAAEVGVPIGAARRGSASAELMAELDACVGNLYGLDAEDLQTVYATFGGSVDYSVRCRSAIGHLSRIQMAVGA